MATINVPDTTANVSIPSVKFAEEDTTGGFLGGLVTGLVESAPDIMKARKEKMKLLAAGDLESSLQVAGTEFEKGIANLRSQLQTGMPPQKAKLEANILLPKIARKYGIPIKEAKELQALYNEQINDLGYRGESSGAVQFWTTADGSVRNNLDDPAVQKNVSIATLSRVAPATFTTVMNNPDLQEEVLNLASRAEIGGYNDSIDKARLSKMSTDKQKRELESKRLVNVRTKDVYGQLLTLTRVQMEAVKSGSAMTPELRGKLLVDLKEHIRLSADPEILTYAGMTYQDYEAQFGNLNNLLDSVDSSSKLKNKEYATSVLQTQLDLEAAKAVSAAPAKDRLNLALSGKIQALNMAGFYARQMGSDWDFSITSPSVTLERVANIEMHSKRATRDLTVFKSAEIADDYAFQTSFDNVLQDLDTINFAINKDERGFAVAGMDIQASLDAAKEAVKSKAYKDYVATHPEFVGMHQKILQSIQNIEDKNQQLN